MVYINDNGSKSNPKSSFRKSSAQILAVCIKNVLLLSFGMTLGFPTILIPGLSGSTSNETFVLGQEAISWIGSVNLICVPVGCMVSGAVTQPIGRKRAMQLVSVPFVIAWLIFKFSNSVWQIFLALCITGLTGGLLEAPVITYVAEICQPSLRGMLSSTSTMAVILGILIQFILGTYLNWRSVALVSSIFPLMAFTLLFFVPESPHWLITKNRLLDARKSIAWLRGWTSLDDIEPEFKELYRYVGKCEEVGIDNPAFEGDVKSSNGVHKRNPKPNSTLEQLKLFTKSNFLRPYAVVSFFFFLGHFSGMTTLQTYAVQIFASLHVPIDKYIATVYLGVAELVGCIVCVFAVRILGKRVLNILSTIGCGICFAIVGTYAYILDVEYIPIDRNATNLTAISVGSADAHYTWIPLTFLIGSAFLSHAGIRVLPWILTGELYSNETRAAASGLSSGIGYVFGFLTNITFLMLTRSLTMPGTLWLYSAVSFIGCIILYFILPETEGKSLHDITNHYSGGKKLDNKVKRKKTEGIKSTKFGTENFGFDLHNIEKNGQNSESHRL